MFHTRDTISFDNTETHFTGKIVFFHTDDTFNVLLDPEFAEFDGQQLRRVNPDYCEVLVSYQMKQKHVAEAQRYIVVHQQLVDHAGAKLATAKARLEVMNSNLTEKLEQL